MSNLATKIKTSREKKGWSQQKLAKQANVPQSVICYIEKNQRKPRIDTLQKLACALGVSITELLDEDTQATA